MTVNILSEFHFLSKNVNKDILKTLSIYRPPKFSLSGFVYLTIAQYLFILYSAHSQFYFIIIRNLGIDQNRLSFKLKGRLVATYGLRIVVFEVIKLLIEPWMIPRKSIAQHNKIASINSVWQLLVFERYF